MGNRILVSFNLDELSGLDDTIPQTDPLTEKQACMLLQACLLFNNRYLWDDMTDAQWDATQGLISETLNRIDKQ